MSEPFVITGITGRSALLIERLTDGSTLITASLIDHASGQYSRVPVAMNEASVAELVSALNPIIKNAPSAPILSPSRPALSITGMRLTTAPVAVTAPTRLTFAMDDQRVSGIVHAATCELAAELFACDAERLLNMLRTFPRSTSFCVVCRPMGEDTSALNYTFANVTPARMVNADAWRLLEAVAPRMARELEVRP